MVYWYIQLTALMIIGETVTSQVCSSFHICLIHRLLKNSRLRMNILLNIRKRLLQFISVQNLSISEVAVLLVLRL